MRSALVLTVSDAVSAGERQDESGGALTGRLTSLGYRVESAVVPDDQDEIARAIVLAADRHDLVIATGGTGLGPRDRTPQTVHALLDYEIPGFGEVMRACGRASTPLADLSRSLGGVLGQALVVAVPGSPRGALESLAAIEPLLDHALETLAGHTAHAADGGPDADAASDRG
jgi:molybdenum cofactor synthesis domain-containing protein